MEKDNSVIRGRSNEGPHQPGGNWKASLAAVLSENNGRKEGGSVASYATQDKRADVLYAGFAELRKLGFRLESVESLRGKHLEALTQSWQTRGLSASTIQNSLSIFRTFATWIGKAGMVLTTERYLGPGVASRSSIATQGKSWSGKGRRCPDEDRGSPQARSARGDSTGAAGGFRSACPGGDAAQTSSCGPRPLSCGHARHQRRT